jgi:hypothetical protein
MLLDDFLPVYDFDESHVLVIQSSPSRIFCSIKELTPSEWSPVINLLLAIRSFPERLFGKGGLQFAGDKPLLDQMFQGGFILLAETTDHELVLGTLVPGTIGQFWNPSARAAPRLSNVQDFVAFDRPDYARVATNFYVGEHDETGRATLSTQTRVQALGPGTRKSFALYWRLIYPGSALIRRLWLKAIQRRAETNRE